MPGFFVVPAELRGTVKMPKTAHRELDSRKYRAYSFDVGDFELARALDEFQRAARPAAVTTAASAIRLDSAARLYLEFED